MSKFVRNNLLKNTIVSLKETHMEFNDQGIAEVPEEYLDEVLELTNYFQVNEDGSEYSEESNQVPNETNQVPGENANETEDDDTDVSVPENETEDQLKATLEGMTIKQLARYAVKEKINLGAATKKDEIISVILENKVIAQ
jgi:TATA-binding protein-associated factor Taf7